ncbi:MAG TPA: hypothetical protein VFE96_01735 [Candidatus Bathyarchaeia archaeon]|nr:hypothetical protein [Candidatus Bathyarchaeia archaeon]
MSSGSIEGSTLLERFVALIPLPYPWAALIWSIILPSGLGFDLISYLGTGTAPLSLEAIPNVLLNFLFIFYAFIMIRYMRLKVVAEESSTVPRLSGGKEDYHRAFGRMTQTIPVIIMTAVFGTIILAGRVSDGTLPLNPFLILANAIVTYLGSLAFSTYFWEFAIASWGLHKLGGSSLRLGSFLEDRMMGVRPMGSLALSLAIAYFGGVLFAALLFSTISPPTLASQWPFIAFLVLGIAFFLLPLNSIHVKMQAEKRRLLREVSARYPTLAQDPSMTRDSATLEDVHAKLAKLTDLQEVEMLDRRIAALPTWPFDISVASKFITIVLSVTAVLLSRVITNFLHI